ncbi:MAG: response regulator [Abitibacteriaceae bacterium]|nr:response regulator [Abditibacteriaceae bacterium]
MALPVVPSDGKFRILVIEDEPDVSRLILASLDTVGFECHSAPDGIAGLTAFEETDPHLVITDIMMPAMTGRELVQRIREKSTVPVIMVTALDSEADELQGLKVGADDYITKPFTPKKLIAHVVTHLRRVYRYNDTLLGGINLDGMSKKPVWAKCEGCGYMGPREKFEKENWRGDVNIVCPNCKKSEEVKFNLN